MESKPTPTKRARFESPSTSVTIQEPESIRVEGYVSKVTPMTPPQHGSAHYFKGRIETAPGEFCELVGWSPMKRNLLEKYENNNVAVKFQLKTNKMEVLSSGITKYKISDNVRIEGTTLDFASSSNEVHYVGRIISIGRIQLGKLCQNCGKRMEVEGELSVKCSGCQMLMLTEDCSEYKLIEASFKKSTEDKDIVQLVMDQHSLATINRENAKLNDIKDPLQLLKKIREFGDLNLTVKNEYICKMEVVVEPPQEKPVELDAHPKVMDADANAAKFGGQFEFDL